MLLNYYQGEEFIRIGALMRILCDDWTKLNYLEFWKRCYATL